MSGAQLQSASLEFVDLSSTVCASLRPGLCWHSTVRDGLHFGGSSELESRKVLCWVAGSTSLSQRQLSDPLAIDRKSFREQSNFVIRSSQDTVAEVEPLPINPYTTLGVPRVPEVISIPNPKPYNPKPETL